MAAEREWYDLDTLAEGLPPLPQAPLPIPSVPAAGTVGGNGDGSDLARARAYVAKVPPAAEGSRNSDLNALAYRLLERFNLAEGELVDLCLSWAAACAPPLDPREVARTCRSAYLAAKRKGTARAKRTEPRAKVTPGGTPTVDERNEAPAPVDEWEAPVPFAAQEVPPFPLEVFPDWLKAFVEGEAEATQTPPDLAGLLALAALAAASGGRWRLTIRPGWTQPLNLFVVCALPPASRKSAVFWDLAAPLEAWERDAGTKAAPDIQAARNRKAILEKTLARRQEAAAKAEGPQRDTLAGEAESTVRELGELRIPAAPRLIVDDVTPEKLAGMLAENGGRLAVLSAEGGIFGIMRGRYARNGEENFEVFLKGHEGDTLRVDRNGRAPDFVESPALTVGLAVQPEIIRGLAACQSMRGRGLLARFLYALPKSNVGMRRSDPPPVPEAIRAQYAARLLALCNVEAPQGPEGEPSTHALTLDANARAAVVSYLDALEPRLGPAGGLGSALAEWAGKLTAALCRVAGLLHLAAHAGGPTPAEVTAETVKRALALGPYLEAHARAAFAELGADPAQGDARNLLDWLKGRGLERFTERDLYRNFPNLKDAEERRAVLAHLEDRGFIRPAPVPPSNGKPGRKASPAWEVNPLLERGV